MDAICLILNGKAGGTIAFTPRSFLFFCWAGCLSAFTTGKSSLSMGLLVIKWLRWLWWCIVLFHLDLGLRFIHTVGLTASYPCPLDFPNFWAVSILGIWQPFIALKRLLSVTIALYFLIRFPRFSPHPSPSLMASYFPRYLSYSFFCVKKEKLRPSHQPIHT